MNLHPRIASVPQIQPDQIRDIHWPSVSSRLHASKTRKKNSAANGAAKPSAGTNASNAYVRKPAECMRRYTKLRGAAKGGAEKAGASKGPWTEEEDRKVVELVGRFGPKKWSQIASELPGTRYLDLYLSCYMS